MTGESKNSENASERGAARSKILEEVRTASQLQTQNFQLVVQRVEQMGDSFRETAKSLTEALETMKTATELLTEYMAQLTTETERLQITAAALIRYSQEQAALQASGGNQG